MKSLYFCGDLHRNWKPIKRWSRMVENANLIQVGDFGLGFKPKHLDERDLSYLSDSLARRGNMLFACAGNHDDPSWFKNKKYGQIFLVDRNTTLNIGGKIIYFCGGAVSIDRAGRCEGRDYWPDEGFNWDGRPPKNKPDCVVTHTAGSWRDMPPYPTHDQQLKTDLQNETIQLDNLRAALTEANMMPRVWLFGHFHKPMYFNDGTTVFRGLDIDEIFEWATE